MSRQKNIKYNFILDSGAFTAWTKKIDIDIDNYIDFALKNIDVISYVVNLDVIPGEFGKIPTKKEVEKSAQKGYDNYLYMIERGVPKEKLIHVFHQGENFDWLQRLIDEDFQYIGLSPANDRKTEEKIYWLDDCMNYVTDSKGKAIIKFHGFAVTSFDLIIRYPWYSIDSASWRMLAAYGNIIVPQMRDNKYVYNKKPLLIPISENSPSIKNQKQHYLYLPQKAKEYIIDYLETISYTVEKAIEDYYTRLYINLIYLNNMQIYLTKNPVTFKKIKKGFGL